MAGRVSLYAAKRCSRNVGPGGSHATAKYSRILLAQELPQHRRHPEVAWLGTPLRGREVRQRVIGAIEIAGAVEDEEALRHGVFPAGG